MRTLDFSPLYRTTVGFDHLSNLLDSVNRAENAANGYPPYNIESIDSDRYQITMAIAGFTEEELDIQLEKQTLTVKGEKPQEDDSKNYLHRGIAARNFERRFQLADHVEVTSARLENGLLDIQLVRVIPEAMKPKTIAINSSTTSNASATRLLDSAKRDAAEAA